MRSDIVSIEPQIVQFGRENVQTIKIINNTSSMIANFFFCLYNTEKFQFSPDSFSLAPNEHKLITITLKIKSTRSMAKQFAYLKSTQINKRITLLINNFQSPQMKRSRMGQQGMEDINTLSSREYKDIQTQAIQKIIREKDAYIQLLEKDKVSSNKNINFRTEESAQKIYLYKREAEELQIKLVLAENQKQAILKENLVLQQKFEEYRQYCQTDLKNYEKVNSELNERNGENIKLHQEIQYLQDQGQQFLQKLEEKQIKIRELEQLNKKVIQDQRKEAEKKFIYLEERLEEQKKAYMQASKQSQERIKDLQRKLSISESIKEKAARLQSQIKRKDDQLRNLNSAFETERNTLKQLEGQKKKLIKFQLMNQSINEKNNDLSSRLKEYEQSNNTLREEIFAYKSKLAQNDVSSDKMNQYLEIALESCRNQNQSLKRSKNQLQKSLDEFMHINRQSHDNNKSLSEQLSKYKEEINLLMEIKDNLQHRNQELKQEHHLALMQLKSQNIALLQKLSYGQSTKREEKIRKLEEELSTKINQIETYKVSCEEAEIKTEELLRDNNKLSQKVKKYKKQAKKQLRSINDTAINQLHRQHDEKKKMAQRIIELEEVIVNYSCEKEKMKSQSNNRDQETRLAIGLQTQSHLRKERASSRIIGIKDQRKQINETNKAYSVTSQQQVYAELGELRELNNYIRNQQDRLTRMFELDGENEIEESSLKMETRPIFRVIQFFKKIENKMREFKGESQLVNIKQIQYLKGRIRQLQSTKEVKQNTSSINLSKTREQCGQLLQYVREQMKNQYKKLNQTTKLWQQKYDLLKKKIFEQYRSKIIEVLNKKEKSSISQLEIILERFIDGMSNLSHKEAVLQKEVKLKQNARRTNAELKEKVTQLNSMLQSKKGYCSREPLKVIFNQTEIEWQESLKREAEFLTLTAEYQRLKQQFELISEELSDGQQQIKIMQRQADDKSAEILRLKKYQVQIQSNYQSQIQKQFQIIEQNKKRIMDMTKSTKESIKTVNRERQYNNLKENFDRQKEIVKVLRDKEKMLEEILEESHRSEEKERKKVMEESRVTETIKDLKENNRDLRNENAKLKQKNIKLEEELDKKNVYLKNIKGDLQENRVRVQRKEEVESQKLRDEVRRLTQQLKKVREELQKIKKKKDHELSQLRNEIDKLRNQSLITQKSLESIIRAIMSTTKKIYGRLRRLIKKRKGRQIQDHQKLFQTSQGVHINALQIDEIFEEVLAFLEQND